MPIANLDGLIAGFQPPVYFEKVAPANEAAGVLHSLFYTPGIPGPAAVPASAITGDALTSYPGQLPFPSAGGLDIHLAGLRAFMTNAGRLLLLDRLWHNAGISPSTTAGQAVGSAAWPARDANGESDGEGVLVGIEVSTATTNTGAIGNTTLSYTNSAGAAGRTATILSFPATAVAGTFVPFLLAPGDVGVRSIQALTLGTSYAPTGAPVIHLVAYRVIGDVVIAGVNSGWQNDAFQLGLPQMHEGSVPFLAYQLATAAATTVRGFVTYAKG